MCLSEELFDNCYNTMEVDKTPVTILNETMSKIRSTVHYELGPDDFTSHPPVFTCKVICDGVTAAGSGRSKKEAKQNAAQAMLVKISKRTVITQPSTVKLPSRSTDVTGMSNTMQELRKLCCKYDFEEPVFNDLDVTGPPHERIFSVQCSVSTLSEVGMAKSKKQAKIDAASKMIKKIQDTFSVENLLNKESTKNTMQMDKNGDNGNNFLKSTHKRSTGESAKLKINYGFKVPSERKELMENSQDLSLALLPKVENLQKLMKEFQQDLNEKNVKKVKQEFQRMLESVKIDFHHMLLQTSDPTTYMLIIQLNTTPDILEMSLGSTREEAELRTIIKVTETLRVLLN